MRVPVLLVKGMDGMVTVSVELDGTMTSVGLAGVASGVGVPRPPAVGIAEVKPARLVNSPLVTKLVQHVDKLAGGKPVSSDVLSAPGAVRSLSLDEVPDPSEVCSDLQDKEAVGTGGERVKDMLGLTTVGLAGNEMDSDADGSGEVITVTVGTVTDGIGPVMTVAEAVDNVTDDGEADGRGGKVKVISEGRAGLAGIHGDEDGAGKDVTAGVPGSDGDCVGSGKVGHIVISVGTDADGIAVGLGGTGHSVVSEGVAVVGAGIEAVGQSVISDASLTDDPIPREKDGASGMGFHVVNVTIVDG